MLLPPLTGLTTQGPGTVLSVGEVRSWKAGVGRPALSQARLVADLVHAEAAGRAAAADEYRAAGFENRLKLAALAPLAVEDGEDEVGRGVEGGQIVRRDVREMNCVTGVLERRRDRPAAGQAHLAFVAGSAGEDGDGQGALCVRASQTPFCKS